MSLLDQRITSLVSALANLDTVSDADYPTVRLTILQTGGDDFLNGIRIALPPQRLVITHEDGEVTVEYAEADPFEIEKGVLISVIKNVLQIAYTTRWLSSE